VGINNVTGAKTHQHLQVPNEVFSPSSFKSQNIVLQCHQFTNHDVDKKNTHVKT